MMRAVVLIFGLLPLVLLLLLDRGLPVSAEGGVGNGTAGFTYVVNVGAWPLPPLLHQPYKILADRTRFGRPIPGHAKRSKCCGRANYQKTRIVGGTDTKPNEFPWMAALVQRGMNRQFCGGSLINDRYVLTAGHCVTPAVDMQVIFSKYAVNENSGRDLRIDVQETILHPRYSDELYTNDIALVKLAVRLILPIGQNLIAPICLPTPGEYTHTRVEAIGWGYVQEGGPGPDRLKSVEMVTINNLRCGVLNAPIHVTADMICAGPKNIARGGKDACQGDSGSPLMATDRYRRKRYTAIGIVSWGLGCARPSRPGVYARVTYFLDWIITNTADATYC